MSRRKIQCIYYQMIYRCYSPSCKAYNNYGGRGIGVCNKWRKNFETFYNWAINNGWKIGLQIDRIKNNGNYSPQNCRFVSRDINHANRRNTLHITYNGKKTLLKDWCEEIGKKYCSVRKWIIDDGLKPEDVFKKKSTPGRTSVMVEINGITKTLLEWSVEYNIKPKTIYARVNIYGHDIKSAITTPVKKSNRIYKIKHYGSYNGV